MCSGDLTRALPGSERPFEIRLSFTNVWDVVTCHIRGDKMRLSGCIKEYATVIDRHE